MINGGVAQPAQTYHMISFALFSGQGLSYDINWRLLNHSGLSYDTVLVPSTTRVLSYDKLLLVNRSLRDTSSTQSHSQFLAAESPCSRVRALFFVVVLSFLQL